MAYTVKKISELSGVSVRTLHFYDEIGLLKPAYYGTNGYRFYEEQQLLMLQQILFFRELGLELKKIHKILTGKKFDMLVALSSHREVLRKKIGKSEELIKTIDKTIDHLKGKNKMKEQDIYQGFARVKQEEYERYLLNRFADGAKETIAQTHENLKNWTKSDFEKSQAEFARIIKELAALMAKNYTPDSDAVQPLIDAHCKWLIGYWTPDKDSYIGLSQCYIGFEWKEAFEAYDSEHPRLAKYLAEAMRIYAINHL